MSQIKEKYQKRLDDYIKAETFIKTKLQDYSGKVPDNIKAKLWDEIYPLIKLVMEQKLKDGGWDRTDLSNKIMDSTLKVIFGVDYFTNLDKLS